MWVYKKKEFIKIKIIGNLKAVKIIDNFILR